MLNPTSNVPVRPNSVAETGIEGGILLRLVAKTMTIMDTATATRLAKELRLSKMIINGLLKELTDLSLIESRGLETEDIKSDIRYSLSDGGARFAMEAMEQSQYIGPAPVSLDTFRAQMKRQSISNERIDRPELIKCLSHLVFPEYLLDHLGPAVNSAKSILLYGEAGNGKTSIAEAMSFAFKDVMYFPYCIEVGGQFINFFDPAVHERVDDDVNAIDVRLDERWVSCRRPVVMTGGELTLEMLDLIFNAQSKFYEAPLHMKAAGGVFVVDDFGRQQTPPQALINRWIVPLERGHDYLTLHTGKKFEIPFDQLVIFSTNIQPRSLTDEAGLRRLYHKIFVPTPAEDDYKQIFRDVCRDRGMACDEAMLDWFYVEKYERPEQIPAGHHPRYLIDFVIALSTYRVTEPVLDRESLELAWENLNVR
jgi:hypothetical protein